MLKIISWNIRQGGGTRISKICDKLIQSEAHIIILSEFRNNKSGDLISEKLLKHGYKYQNKSNAIGNINSVAFFSKLDNEHLTFPDSDPTFPDNVIASKFDAFIIYGVYLPHKKKHVLFDFLIDQVKENSACIIAGDYNTGKNYIDQAGDSFWYTDKLVMLESLNCIDAFRLKQGDVKEFSWYSHQGNGYRYDHTYVSEDLHPVVSNCYYIHEWREENLSDHSPMVLELG